MKYLPLFLILLFSLSLKSQVTPAEKAALQVVYNELGGPAWDSELDGDVTNDWNFAQAVTSNWYGVEVEGGHITVLNLSSFNSPGKNNLIGAIPPEIGNFPFLRKLAIGYAKCEGSTLPKEIGLLDSLRYLDLSGSDIEGNIPPEVGQLKKLEYIRLNSNKFSGPIPKEIGAWTNLWAFSMSRNELTSIPDEICNLTKLRYLYADRNMLTCSIPSNIGNLQILKNFDLSVNPDLSGTIPASLGTIPTLLTIRLSETSISGTIPSSFGGLSSIKGIWMEEAKLSGSIPSEIGNLNTLVRLDLSENTLSGSMPPFAGLASIQSIDLSVNKLTGSIPATFGVLSTLESLFLSENELSGTLPIALADCISLRSLYLSDNKLTGSIPKEYGNMSELRTIYLYDNKMSGQLPKELAQATNLTSIHLSGNDFSGPIPAEFANMVNLKSFYIYQNQFSGKFPDLSNTLIKYLGIYHNAFQFGDLEDTFNWYETHCNYSYDVQADVDEEEVKDLVSGDDISLTVNCSGINNTYQWFKDGVEVVGATTAILNLTNVQPEDAGEYYCKVKNTTVLDLVISRKKIMINVESALCTIDQSEIDALLSFYNSTNGPNWYTENDGDSTNDWDINNPIENWFGVTVDCDKAAVERLEIPSDNNLEGTISPNMGSFSSIETIVINDNPKLIGAIPSTLGFLTEILHISLMNNNLTGSIPDWIGNAIKLTTIQLSDNNLTGSVPESFSDLLNLKVLYVDGNQLSGTFPDLTNGSLAELRIQENNFQFGDFENEFYFYKAIDSGASVSPQGKLEVEETIMVNAGEGLTISVTCSGDQNYYQWLKDGVAIVGATTPTLMISNAHVTDAGVYDCDITSDLVLPLTIQRNIITLVVEAQPAATEGPGGVIDNNIFWVSASEGISFAGAGVAAWENQSSGINDATQTEAAYRPTVVSSVHNYNPSVYFDGENDYLDIENLVGANSKAISIFAVGTNESGGDSWHSMVMGQCNSSWTGGGYGISSLVGVSELGFWVNNYNEQVVSAPLQLDRNEILEGKYDGTQVQFYQDAFLEGSSPYTGIIGEAGTTYIGGGAGTDYSHKGHIAEVAIFSEGLSSNERNKINSYLGIKYAITVDRGGVSGSYINSDGNTIYASENSYWNNIIGIAKDTKSRLLQKQSHLADDSTRIYLATIAGQNQSNTGSFSSDKQSVVMGSNTGPLYATMATANDKPNGVFRLIDRSWQVTNKDFDGTFNFDVLLDECALVNPISTADIRLLVDTDGDFSDAQVYNNMSGLTFMKTGNLISIIGVANNHIPMNSTVYIALGTMTNPIVTKPYNLALCGGSIEVNGTTYDANNPTGVEILTASTGCDSIVSINLTFENIETDYVEELCAGAAVEINGTLYDEGNPTGTETFVGVAGCDSIVNINLSFASAITTGYFSVLCLGESVEINGTIYDEGNPLGVETLTSVAGCDSIVDVKLEFVESIVTDYQQTLCPGEMQTINGSVYNMSNASGSEVLTSYMGCDSVVNISLTFLEENVTEYQPETCKGGSMELEGVVYNESNPTGVITLVSASGCDSVVNISLVFLDQAVTEYVTTSCAGGTVVINGVAYTEANPSGVDTLTSFLGCDSVVSVNVEFIESYGMELSQTLCQGESVTINGTVYDENNPTGTEVLMTPTGCDSTIIIALLFAAPIHVNVDTMLCVGASILLEGQIFDVDNPTGTLVLTGATGCDSIVHLSLSFYSDEPVAHNDAYVLYVPENYTFDILENDVLPENWTVVLLGSDDMDGWALTEDGQLTVYGDRFSDGEELTIAYQVCDSNCDMLCSTGEIHLDFSYPMMQDDVVVSEILTLNHDGKNDVLFFKGSSVNEGITIFNRWGDLIFSEFPYQNAWDGKNQNGEDLPSGTYYYVLYLNRSEGETIKGDVLIVR